jgi:sugar lactone lactonase YvrE
MNRLESKDSPSTAAGWRVERIAGPSPLFGANGMKVAADGRLVVAEAFGSQVSTVDVESGACAPLIARGGAIVAPDDVAFDTHDVLFITEVMSERVSAREPDGSLRVIAAGVPVANGITSHGDRIFMDEFRPGGRVMELYADGRAPRTIARDLDFPNALAMGPDDRLYFPLVVAGEIWRVAVAGGTPERVFAGLDHPTAVKFDPSGRLHAVEAGNGEIASFDLQSGTKTKLASVRPGIDNFAFAPDGRMFVSHFVDGGVSEIVAGGRERAIVAAGFVGPFDVAAAAGRVFVADGLSLVEIVSDGVSVRRGRLLEQGWPGFVRGVAAGADGEVLLANTAGDLVRLLPGPRELRASGLGDTHGIAIASDGSALVADTDGGRVVRVDRAGGVSVVARGLARPLAVAVGEDGAVYASESARGRVVRVDAGVEVVIEGLREPHGIAVAGRSVYALDRAAKTLVHRESGSASPTIVASGLPVGDAPGVVAKPLPGMPLIPGPIRAFAGIAAAGDGTIYVAADGEGSVLRITRA